MPCYDPPRYPDGTPLDPASPRRKAGDLDVMTRLACGVCQELEKTGAVPEWACDWWERHKQWDQLCEQRDREIAEINKR